MKKVLCILLSIMLIMLAACSPADNSSSVANTATNSAQETTTEPSESVEIQFMHSFVEQERQDVIIELISKFEAENPGITIEQIPVNEDSYETRITTLGSSGELPAVIEMGHDFAKSNARNDFIDYEAVNNVITAKGADEFYDGVLNVVTTEDGMNYTGVPSFGWVQGIFYDIEMLETAGFSAPTTWEEIIEIAETFHDPDNKKYGIAIPTAESGFTEQVFSQFALSNEANVFDTDGNVVFGSPEMGEALTYYNELAAFTMPGSNDVSEVRDAFMNGSAPMAIYSTYILPAAYEEGIIGNVGFAVPTNKVASTFGSVSVFTISSDLEDDQKMAAEKFISFMIEDANNIAWLHMSPGGAQPVLKSVGSSEDYLNNEVIQSFEHISVQLSQAFNNLQVFGSVDGKNFLAMGEVTQQSIISKAINNVVVNGADIETELANAQAAIEDAVG